MSKIALVESEESYSYYCASGNRVARISVLWGIGVYCFGNRLKVLITEQNNERRSLLDYSEAKPMQLPQPFSK